MNRKKQIKLEEEGGVTENSIHNAELLIKIHGKPIHLDFRANVKQCDYFVDAIWADGFQFRFTGFSWGYGGTGSEGLNYFLKLIDSELRASSIPIDKFQKTDCSWSKKQ